MTNQRAIETLAHLLDWLAEYTPERPDMAEVSMAIGIACMALETEPYYTPEDVVEKLAVDSAYITPPFDTGLIPPFFCYRESRAWGRCENQCRECMWL